MPRLFDFLSCGNLITANHAMAEMAIARPDWQDGVTAELLKVEGYKFDTGECHNIALGKVIVALDSYMDRTHVEQQVTALVERQASNNRNATKKKAQEFLKKRKSLPG